MAACLAASSSFAWATLTLGAVWGAAAVFPPPWYAAGPAGVAARWLQTYFEAGLFVFVGASVAAVWSYQAASGAWKRSADGLDLLGRVVGVLWLAIGFVWSVRLYMELLR